MGVYPGRLPVSQRMAAFVLTLMRGALIGLSELFKEETSPRMLEGGVAREIKEELDWSRLDIIKNILYGSVKFSKE